MLNSLAEYGLDLIDCPKCNNTGSIVRTENGVLFSRECECMAQRRALRRIRNSGMGDLLERYTFDAYKTPDPTRTCIKMVAERFCDSETGWFYIFGRSGSGKTHICTAICSRLISSGKDTYYMRWRDEVRQLKAVVNTEEASPMLDRLKRVSVLYIDDFFKGGVSEADIRIAFEILNSRYNDSRLRTVISSEMSIEEVLDIDEAIGGRIKERSKGFMVKSVDENWRLK